MKEFSLFNFFVLDVSDISIIILPCRPTVATQTELLYLIDQTFEQKLILVLIISTW